MNQKVTLAALLTVLLAAAVYYQSSPSAESVNSDNVLDLTCGFTDDFANFIKNNGKDSTIQDTRHGTSTGQILSALPLEGRHRLRRKL